MKRAFTAREGRFAFASHLDNPDEEQLQAFFEQVSALQSFVSLFFMSFSCLARIHTPSAVLLVLMAPIGHHPNFLFVSPHLNMCGCVRSSCVLTLLLGLLGGSRRLRGPYGEDTATGGDVRTVQTLQQMAEGTFLTSSILFSSVLFTFVFISLLTVVTAQEGLSRGCGGHTRPGPHWRVFRARTAHRDLRHISDGLLGRRERGVPDAVQGVPSH